ncbi:MBOAT family O-acyltransferase [Photobacterium kasasachensis]|uniref:MBOAT family O-acyltransferase n=1 Tax=Photobacterium kasasachensis TaxID=2910240 RepID=UPI003D0BC08D
MSFISITFLFFLPIVFLVYFIVPMKQKPWVMLFASYSFYAYWDWRYLPLIFISTIVDYYCALLMGKYSERSERRPFLYLSLLVNLGILISFKYWNFVGSNLNGLFDLELELHNLLLPLGISFYTLQTLSYTFDVYLGKIKPEKKLSDFCLYVSFFPQLVAGPIERSGHLIPQLKTLGIPTQKQFRHGLLLIVWGVFLKLVIADNLTIFIHSIYFVDTIYPFWIYWLAGGLALVKIYCDFMAYSEMARGVAKLFGVELSINFRRPLFAKTLREFWQRWHISLTRWIGDYVFKPLALKYKSKVYRNVITILTLCLIGLWHGASWNFIMFGVLQGVIILLWDPIACVFNNNIKIDIAYRRAIGMLMVAISMMFTTTIFYIVDTTILIEIIQRQLDVTSMFMPFSPFKLEGKTSFVFSLSGILILLLHSYLCEYKKIDIFEMVAVRQSFYSWPIALIISMLIISVGKFSNEQFIYFEF